ncbi:probable serine hydrolase [Agrilus planipennis]|uniref:Probable serine hydrolase n=1 Tax=Agrilus planipennis TaxID=224129 RepID=A0A1W4WGD8_AGRPL|nr:probable serine hydrolase [Agrilus planipennis]
MNIRPMRSVLNLNVIVSAVRKCSSVNLKNFSTIAKECVEIKIPVPWGHIAAKWWGSQNERPILSCHGWQDNSGTFDRLIPYLPSDVSLLAIDFPGHGYSSRLPLGMWYNGMDYIVVLERIVDYFKWPKVSLMGHSLGAIQSYLYSVLFPERIEFLICLDAFHPFPTDDYKTEDFRKNITRYLKYDNLCASNTEPPSYTPAKLSEIWHEGSRKSVDVENCKYILERNVMPSKTKPNHFYFTRDPRLKIGVKHSFSQKQIVEQASRVRFPICVFKANDNDFSSASPLTYQLLDIIKENTKDYYFLEVGGTHHVHLNNPERVGPHIHNFIKKYYSCNLQAEEHL